MNKKLTKIKRGFERFALVTNFQQNACNKNSKLLILHHKYISLGSFLSKELDVIATCGQSYDVHTIVYLRFPLENMKTRLMRSDEDA